MPVGDTPSAGAVIPVGVAGDCGGVMIPVGAGEGGVITPVGATPGAGAMTPVGVGAGIGCMELVYCGPPTTPPPS